MSGYRDGRSGPPNFIRRFASVAPSAAYIAPDGCIGLIANVGNGDVSFSTVDDPERVIIMRLNRGVPLFAEIHKITAFSADDTKLFAIIG